MRLDPQVARRKYDREVASLERQREVLRRRGCILMPSEYPYVDAIFLPQRPVALANNGAVGHFYENISAKSFGVRLDLEGFDVLAPSITFRNPLSWEILPFPWIPTAFLKKENGEIQLLLLDMHPHLHRPFLCVVGTREFHSHIEHTDVDWFDRRVTTGALDLFFRILDYMCDQNPVFNVAMNFNFTLNWGDVKIGRQPNGPG